MKRIFFFLFFLLAGAKRDSVEAWAFRVRVTAENLCGSRLAATT